ncbi:hypothetical protein [Nocardioides yefusunii]|uniref:S1 motif domain-containing protein n=1 Tax=Nocardioides yefusunii TaxID=2500546 RepID=A0ABW1QSN5_9ACTN|nr:hypothetical protein [Nocardioides yefusunii]
MNTVTTAAAAEDLARNVTDAGRTRVVVVLTAPPGEAQPWFDVEEILTSLGGDADVHLLATGEAVWAFCARIPEAAQVLGGAGRVYPPGRAWLDDPTRFPLRFPAVPADAVATAVLVDDALAMVARANWRSGRIAAGRRRVTGVVKGAVANRALVRLDAGGFASITPALTVPGIPLERLVSEGQQVTGLHDPASRWLDVHDSLRPASQFLKAYKVGRVVLVEVARVEQDHLVVRLHPDVEVRVEGADAARGNAALVTLYSPGDVVRAVVVTRPPAWAVRLVDVPVEEPVRAAALLPGGPAWLVERAPEQGAASVPAAAPGAVMPRPAVPAPPRKRPGVPGIPRSATTPSKRELDTVRRAERETGEPPAVPVAATPAALVGRRPVPLTATPVVMTPAAAPKTAASKSAAPSPGFPSPGVPKPATPRPTATPQPVHSTSPAGAVRLPPAGLKPPTRVGKSGGGAGAAEFAALLQEFALLERERARLETRVESLNEQLRDQRSQLRKAVAERAADAPAVFADPEFGFRHAVLGAWARRIPVAEQASVPLGDFRIGEQFLASVERLGASYRDKVLSVTVEIVCGLAPSLPSREVHRYRESESGGSPYVTRADGAALWRASLQAGTAAARRIHYWILPGGLVELCHVGVHDERPPH